MMSYYISHLIYIIDGTTKRYVMPHLVHIANHLAYFLLNYVFNGMSFDCFKSLSIFLTPSSCHFNDHVKHDW